jgi:glutamate-1-semialdehyde 2,1-aminomutase
MKLDASAKTFARAEKVLVGGTNSPVRSFKRVGGHPVIVRRGEGAFVEDIDGNRYVDFVMSYGPHLLGHAREEIVRAAQLALKNSSCLGFTTEGEIEWAELLLKSFPSADKVRALSTGTEACATAIRLARGITGRDVIIKCAGHYHGHVDSLLVDGGSGLATLSSDPVPDSKGIPKALTDLSRVVQFNDHASLEKAFKEFGPQVAAFILEPVMGNMGCIPPDVSFLKKARQLCTEFGALLIFDEVMTGLRVHKGSAQGRYGVNPDLTTLGKIIGGGLPLSALVGPQKTMNQLAPLGPVYQAGTLSGNPVSIAAGTAMLRALDKESPYERLEALGAHVEVVLNRAAQLNKVDMRVERVGSMVTVFFRSQALKNANDARDSNLERFNRFFWAMLHKGYMLPPSPFEAWFLSTAHEQVLTNQRFADDLTDVFKELRD